MRKKKKLKLRYDELDSFYPEAFAEQLLTELMNQDTLKIFYNVAGCANFDKALLLIIRLDDKSYWIQRREGWGIPRVIGETIITAAQFNQIIAFEKELVKLNGKPGCTTAYCYSFQMNRKIKTYQFADCDHDGLHDLMYNLFSESSSRGD